MRWIVLSLLVLAGCGQRVVVLRDDWLGTLAFYTVEHEIYRDQFAIVEARPIVITGTDGLGYAVLTNVRRRDANGPKVERMTMGAVTLDYVMLDRKRTHCIDGCQKAEVGAIHMSREAFTIAAQTGLSLRIWGHRGRYEGTVPARAFAEVLSQVAPLR